MTLYRHGRKAALRQLGFTKTAGGEYMRPFLAGAAGGGGLGMLLAPEDEKLEGLIAGSLLGGGGAAAGRAVGKGALGAYEDSLQSQLSAAKHNRSQRRLDFATEKPWFIAHPDLDKKYVQHGKDVDRIEKSIGKLKEDRDANVLGATILGGTGGAAMTGANYQPQAKQQDFDPRTNPYGYGYYPGR